MTDEDQRHDLPRIYDNAAGEAFLSTLAGLLVGLDDGIIYYTTEPLEEMFGFSVRGDLIGRHVEILVPRDKRHQHVVDRMTYSADPRPRPMGNSRGLVQGMKRDGTILNLAVSLGKARVLSGIRLVPIQVLLLPIGAVEQRAINVATQLENMAEGVALKLEDKAKDVAEKLGGKL